MTMHEATREDGVLKLVYPGRFVELHKNPITVAEVMRKNPRHCVTRPDVFKFPWVVVRPDSVLNPGRVFFVVPYHTIHRLLQEKGSQDKSDFLPQGHPSDHSQDHLPHLRQPSPSRMQLTPNHIGCESFFRKRSRIVSSSKKNSKAQGQVVAYSSDDQSQKQLYPTGCLVKPAYLHQLLKKKSQDLSHDEPKFKPEDGGARYPRRKQQAKAGSKVMNADRQYHDSLPEKSAMALHVMTKVQQDRDDPPKKQYPVEKWPTAISNHKYRQPRYKPQAAVNPLVEARPLDIRKYAYDAKDPGLQSRNDSGSDLKHPDATTQLKSCLKEHQNNPSRSHGLRVTFAFPLEDNREELKTKPYRLH